MKVIRSIKEFKAYRNKLQSQKTGFIPTMGALHAGHLSLIEQSVDNFQLTIVSIFINPTQFDKKHDLNSYPSQLNADLGKLENAGVDCVFLPSIKQIYPDNYNFTITEKQLSHQFCGALRSGHFDGVLTVVMKLFTIVRPDCAYFGEKDYQQLTLIKQMVSAFFIPIEIITVKTMREKDGLAMSSRNLNLTANERKVAPKLYETISSNLSRSQMTQRLNHYGFKLDYLETMNNRLLVAATLGKVRLIDNVEIKNLEQNKVEHVA